jgi:hypothetical protein
MGKFVVDDVVDDDVVDDVVDDVDDNDVVFGRKKRRIRNPLTYINSFFAIQMY